MRKKTTILLVLIMSACLFSMSQVDLKRQAFEDLNSFFNRVNHVEQELNSIYVNIGAIERMKQEILDDPERKAALKKLIDLHPDYDLADIAKKITKLSTLKTWLEDNGFVQQ